MTVREFYIIARRNELPVFKRVLAALPQDKFAYNPHERSPSTEQIVWTMTQEQDACISLVKTGELNFQPNKPPAPERMLADFEKHYSQLLEDVTKMDESTWHTNGQFKVQGQLRMEMPIGQFLWLFHNDAIHHRGQLAAYIRPMGGKVPSIYGPSGDDPGN